MPKKSKPPLSQEERSRRFEEAARAIEAGGGLSPTEAAEAMDKLVRSTPSTNLTHKEARISR